MSTTPATPGPYSGTSIPATTPAARPPGLAEGFTDAQLQAALPRPDQKAEHWTLLAPPAGRRWHREDWTADMLPEGYRPLLEGETFQTGDEVWLNKEYGWHTSKDGSELPRNIHHPLSRTRRPLPAPSAEPEQPLPDDGPAWIPHDGGPCPLKDEEVEEWECEWDDETTTRWSAYLPPSQCEVWDSMRAYRVLKWKPGHGPQAATFTGPDGRLYNRHTPGDPMLCEADRVIEILTRDGQVLLGNSSKFGYWGESCHEGAQVIGWRYADEPAQAQAEAKPTQAELLAEAMKNPGVADVERVYGGGQPPAQPWTPEPAEDEEWTKHLEELKSPIPAPWTPKPGDVVRLKSGGPEMTVLGLSRKFAGLWDIMWFSNESFTHGFKPLDAACLKPAKEEARP